MTTTKKKAKAKRNPWPPWLDALDDVREVLREVCYEAERRAVSVFVEAGLVSHRAASRVVAERVTPARRAAG